MKIEAIGTRIMQPPKDDIFTLLDEYCPEMRDNEILVVTSKIAAIHQGRCVKVNSVGKEQLIKAEADLYIPAEPGKYGEVPLGIKHNTVLPFAGIDQSNGNGWYILWPENPNLFAGEVRSYLKKRFNINNVGVIISDSLLLPLRKGSFSASIGSYGFKPIRDYKGDCDLFGRPLLLSSANIANAIAAATTVVTGEGSECRPLAIIKGAAEIDFGDYSGDEDTFPVKEDVFYPLLRSFYESNRK